MKLIRRLSAFLLSFALLSWSVAAISAAVFTEDAAGGAEVASTAADTQKAFKPRLSAPSYSNPYYYSDKNIFYEYGWGMPNCTCYAWGRAYELLGSEPNLCVYSAHLWYDYNRDNGIYAYGKEPKLGAIACWKYSDYDSGHVAVVEKIENGTITFSNSAYSGTEFYTNTAPVSDPSNGRKTWIFQGYIYIGEFAASADEPSDDPEQGRQYRITSVTGVNVRSGAGTGNAIIGCLYCDQTVTVTDAMTSGGYTWGRTTYDGMTGWFVLDFAEPIGGGTSGDSGLTGALDPAPLSSGELMAGDLDQDGEITILDAMLIQRILVRLIEPSDYMRSVCDYDSDGEVTILDANRIQRYLVNLD